MELAPPGHRARPLEGEREAHREWAKIIMLILTTERLRLRWFTEDDAEFVCELLNTPGWLEMIGDRGVRNAEDARRWISERLIVNYHAQGFGFWAVERILPPRPGSANPAPLEAQAHSGTALLLLESDGELIGMCGLVKREVLPDADIGYAFVPRAWGQGYAREAAAACLRYAQAPLGLTTVLAITAPHNERSGRLLEAIGLRYVETTTLDPEMGVSKLYRWSAG